MSTGCSAPASRARAASRLPLLAKVPTGSVSFLFAISRGAAYSKSEHPVITVLPLALFWPA